MLVRRITRSRVAAALSLMTIVLAASGAYATPSSALTTMLALAVALILTRRRAAR